MNAISKTDKLFLIPRRAGWSSSSAVFAGKDGLSWLVFATHGDRSIRS
jgi:hypothetical protein